MYIIRILILLSGWWVGNFCCCAASGCLRGIGRTRGGELAFVVLPTELVLGWLSAGSLLIVSEPCAKYIERKTPANDRGKARCRKAGQV